VPYPVSKEHFAGLVEKALADLPAPFAAFLEEVPIEIRSRPTPRLMAEVGLPDDALLLGLYRGRPRTERSIMDSGAIPDVIYLFQRPIEASCDDAETLIEQVRTTLLHEIGHHFGMSEADLEELGYG
jgi:predicted Zn-dependent protease with MMP-like domain